MRSTNTLQPVGESLGVAAVELLDMARLSGRLEILIADLVGRGEAPDPALLIECQIADLLSQRLVGLAAFLAALAAAVPAEARVDVAEAVRGLALSDQARCLAALAPDDARVDGELMLFED